MKERWIIPFISVVLLGCGNTYQPYGSVSSYRSYSEPAPAGMVFIPQGAIRLGETEPDVLWGFPPDNKMVSVDAFWMDETEVTNSKYRQFVYWVRDSIIRERLYDPVYGGSEVFKITEDRYGEPVTPHLNWNRSIPWNRPAEEEQLAIESVYVTNPVTGEKRLDNKQMNFCYHFYDHAAAIRYKKELDELTGTSRTSSILIHKDTAYINENGEIVRQKLSRPLSGYYDFLQTYIVNIYPDESCWLTDFDQPEYEKYAKNYFEHTQYDSYPVVGISWQMATAYCAWRTFMYQRQVPPGYITEPFRLPTEAEWEYAARAGRTENRYPWGKEIVSDGKGCLPGNFKPVEGDYTADGHLVTSQVRSYPPNEFGLFGMAGNVAEWTSTLYSPGGDWKVVKGGSWKDLPPFVRSVYRSGEYEQQSRSYIGFRCVKGYTGTAKKKK